MKIPSIMKRTRSSMSDIPHPGTLVTPFWGRDCSQESTQSSEPLDTRKLIGVFDLFSKYKTKTRTTFSWSEYGSFGHAIAMKHVRKEGKFKRVLRINVYEGVKYGDKIKWTRWNSP